MSRLQNDIAKSASFFEMVKPIAVAGVFFGSIGFALLLTFSNPDVVRSRLHLSPRTVPGEANATSGSVAAKEMTQPTNSHPFQVAKR